MADAAALVLVGGLVLAGLAQLPDQGTGQKGAIYLRLRLGFGCSWPSSSGYSFWPHSDLSARVSASIRGLVGRRITPSRDRMYRFVMTYQFPIVGVVCLFFGAYLVITGLLTTSLRP